MIKAGKKFLSIILTIVMFVTTLVFVLPEKASAATAGSYNIRVTYSSDSSVDGNFYGSIGTEYSDSMGIVVKYKQNNGTGTESSAYFNLKGNKLSGTKEATIAGFPTLLYLYFDDNRVAVFGDTGTATCTKLEVKGTGQTAWTTLWTGVLQVKSSQKPYACSVASDGTTKTDYFGTDKDCKVSNSSGAWTSKFPKASSISAFSISPSEIICPTGSNTTTVTATLGTIKDQYSVNWYQDPYLSVAANPGITRVDNTHIRIDSGAMVTASPWYRRVTIRVRAGSSTGTQVGSDLSLEVANPQYTVTWKWYETNVSNPARPIAKTSTTSGIYYNQTPTAPTDKPTSYYTDIMHYTAGKFTPAKVTGSNTFVMAYTSTNHSWDEGVVTKVQSCSEPGIMKYTCSDCGMKKEDIIKTEDHKLMLTNVKSATCKQKGYTGDKICSECGLLVEKGLVVDFTSHSYKSEVVAPTCVEKGYTIHTCTICGDSYNDDFISKKTHDYTTLKIEPSCEKDGYTKYICKICGDTYNDDYIKANGHNYNNGICNACNRACKCNCHTGGFAGFIWKVQNFFNRIFGSKKYCACGKKHY